MPIFEYKCDSCGTRFEKLLRTSGEHAPLSCPDCGQEHLSRQFSTFAARAKGPAPSAEAPACPSGMCGNPNFCGRN